MPDGTFCSWNLEPTCFRVAGCFITRRHLAVRAFLSRRWLSFGSHVLWNIASFFIAIPPGAGPTFFRSPEITYQKHIKTPSEHLLIARTCEAMLKL